MIRLILGIPIAAVVTIALFLLMKFMITTDRSLEEETKPDVSIQIGRQVEETDLQQQQRQQQRPDQQEPPPPPPAAPPQQTTRPNLAGVPIDTLSGQFGTGFDLNLDIPTDRQARVQVPGQVQYPRRAAQRGTEGYALLQFTVTAEGRAINVQCLEDDPPNTFCRAAERSIDSFRFQPQIRNGEPVSQDGYQYQMIFQLEEDSRGGFGRR